MTTIDEVYFLVRVGSWSEDDLENYIQERIEHDLTQAHDEIYEEAFKEGREEGLIQGAQSMYEQAFRAIKDLA